MVRTSDLRLLVVGSVPGHDTATLFLIVFWQVNYLKI